MAINSEKLMDLVNKHRQQIQDEVDTCCDGATVSAFLLLTFALDHKPDRKIDDEVRRYMAEVARQVPDEAEEIGFTMEQEH